MKKTNKKNKGFSLVELIVVVLIMAIIAVALAPQVMKWVNESRKSSDAQAYDTLVNNVQTALSDESVWNLTTGISDIYIQISQNKGIRSRNAPTKLLEAIGVQYGISSSDINSKLPTIKLTQSGATARIKIVNGAVQRDKEPGPADSVDPTL